MPALKQLEKFEYIGLAAATEREFSGADSDKVRPSELVKAETFISAYGGKIFEGYEALICSNEVDARCLRRCILNGAKKYWKTANIC